MTARALMNGLIVACGLICAIAAPREANAGDAKLDKARAAVVANATKLIEKQGGSRIVFKVDTDALREAMATDLRDDIYRIVREGRIPFSGLALREGGVEIKVADSRNRDLLKSKIAAAGTAPNSIGVTDGGDGLLKFAATEAGYADRLHDLVDQAMEMIDQRLRDLGISQAGVQVDGSDRIRVLLPGVADPERIAAVFARKVQFSLRLVDVSMSPTEAQRGAVPAGSELLNGFKDKLPYLVLRERALDGDDIIDASPGFDRATNQPIVSFRYNGRGTRRFAHITSENIGRPVAIVLDDKVLSAPVIREPITGGSGQISGNLTIEEANSVAMMLRACALPGRLTIVEQQVVDAGAKR